MPIGFNIEKAKEIKKDMLRADRAPLLAQLDVEFIRAVEAGDTALQAEIAAKKQELRDITKAQEITQATTLEELKVFIPEVLRG